MHASMDALFIGWISTHIFWPTRKTHLCQRRERHRFFHQAFLFADRRQSVWIGIWKWHTKRHSIRVRCSSVLLIIGRLCQYLRYTDATNDWKSEKRRNVFIHLTWGGEKNCFTTEAYAIFVRRNSNSPSCAFWGNWVWARAAISSRCGMSRVAMERKERFYVQCELFALSLRSHGMSHAAEA